ncbi:MULTISPECIES: efflux RND transporter periplasmic adaptor subunit [Ralstonia]|uniref:CusB-like beta-barrel domain-containing protein n=7 Tax=Pseudomonadota TaxID=1224 RepID=A0AAD2F418_9RALS|nr:MULTISPECIES: efflux RND transporter periplasmic adaptor subunit [Ralstonia]AJW47341.1 RND transporter [Ralstonia mannitolilytica]ANH72876.1 efflux transporter, RND family, MFP subunit [Ralstonia insidiosa]EPX94431.1 RND transporter [Ralstonia sp. AU12-08]MBY4721405.1 efflux RND transporter periplasmic adaptor subunit [Ralstonia mannitolilytica]OCS50453.1 efflux transporter periplasmic adaptor subunit [Ralstonia pickettii]
MQVDYKSAAIGGVVAGLVVGGLMWGIWGQKRSEAAPTPSYAAAPVTVPAPPSRDGQAVTLSQGQLQYIKVAPVELREFANRREAVGNIDFNEDRAVQVFTSYQGKIRNTYAKVGDIVAKGKPLFDIDSPDLVQAESTLISTAGTRKLTTDALARARQLYEIQGLAQKDLDQAISDQQAAEAAYKAAREALAVFGKTPAQMDQIVQTRKTDSLLTVVSPISGQVTARSAQPGLLLQPGNGTAPFTVADVSTMWMQAFVPEADAPLLHVGQPVKIHVMAFPSRVFNGKITTVGASVDANTHRILVRSEIDDPKHELRPGMFTSFDITTGAPIQSPALAMDGVVREGDGTMTAWVTTDRKRFARRVIKLGLEQDGFVQVLEGLNAGELAANEGALYLSTAASGSVNSAN